MIDAAGTAIHPDSLVVVVVADASQVAEPLKALDWARLDVVED